MIFKPLRSLFSTEMPTSESPLCIHGGMLMFVSLFQYLFTISILEPIEISFALENTIKPSIMFEGIHLLWTFQTESGVNVSNSILFKSEVSTEGTFPFTYRMLTVLI